MLPLKLNIEVLVNTPKICRFREKQTKHCMYICFVCVYSSPKARVRACAVFVCVYVFIFTCVQSFTHVWTYVIRHAYHYTDIDFCISTPCQNNGTCTDGETSHACACVTGYTGADCDEGKHMWLCYGCIV
jgi:hypothetical protein